jgi:histidine triad (HIT) family protein
MPFPAYDSNNIFVKILRGEIPSHKVYEDDNTFAFMDIMPRSDGHTLVIPKVGARNILDITPCALSDLVVKTQRIAIAARLAMKADGITIEQFNEPAGGQLVFHIHFHILPRFDGVKLKPHSEKPADPGVIARHAEAIRAVLASTQAALPNST